MRLLAINSNEGKQLRKPNFKSNIIFDIGGSQREGSCKISYTSTDGKDIFYKEHTTVNDLGKTKFKDQSDFIDHIIEKIKRIQKNSRATVKELGYPEEENKIKNVAVFIPSYTVADKAFYLPNLKNDNDKPLKDIDFCNFKERLEANGIKVDSDMNFKLLQDAMGTGLAMSQSLYDQGLLEEGSLYTACITGGGCGIANIEAIDKDHIIVKSSGSSYLSQSLSLQKVSKAGASAPALIENFCKAMGYNEEMIERIKACHRAEFVLNPEVIFDSKDENFMALCDILSETGDYSVTPLEMSSSKKNDDKFYRLQVLSHKKYNTARRNAIDKYCLALARLAIIKKTEGSNGMIVTGALANAINKCANLYYDLSLSDWVMQHLTQSFNSYELDKLQSVYDFKVFCNDKFSIQNNTECGNLVHEAKFVGNTRRNWLKLSTETLKQNATKVIKKTVI